MQAIPLFAIAAMVSSSFFLNARRHGDLEIHRVHRADLIARLAP
jgi:hypothetical protein